MPSAQFIKNKIIMFMEKISTCIFSLLFSTYLLLKWLDEFVYLCSLLNRGGGGGEDAQ